MFAIPNGETADTFIAEATQVEWYDDDDYVWGGSIGDSEGSLVYMSKPNASMVSININGNNYSILPVKPNIGVFVKHTIPDPDTLICATIEEESPSEIPCSNDECPAVITILMEISSQAKADLIRQCGGNLWLYALRLLFQEGHINTIFANSGIKNKSVKIIWNDFAYTVPSPGDIEQLLRRMANPFDPNNNPFGYRIAQDRNYHKADLVFLLHKQDGLFGVVGGVTYQGLDINKPYSILNSEFFWNPGYTFQHEMGHIFGCRHQYGTCLACDNTPDCAHAWSSAGRTIMWGDRSQQINVFSNPDLGTGNYNINNQPAQNAQRIMSTGCILAGLMPDDWGVSISGPTFACDEYPEYFEAIVDTALLGNPGQPPYTYEWRWNTTGIFTSQNPGTYLSDESKIEIGSLACTFFFLQVKVTSNDNITKISQVRKVISQWCDECSPDPECDDCPPDQRVIQTPQPSNYIKAEGIEISPNPSQGAVQIRFDQAISGYVKISLLNTQGQVVRELLSEEVHSGTFRKKFYLNELTPGLWVIQIQVPDQVFSKKLIFLP